MGLSAAWINHDVRSRDMKKGLIRKSMVALALWTLYLTINILLPMLDPLYSNPFMTIESGITTSFILNEVISLIENAGLMGVEMPEWLTKRFRQLQEEHDNKMDGEKVKDAVIEERSK